MILRDQVRALAGRRQSVSTGTVYHLVHHQPPPDDPGPFVQRADDAPDQIARRLALYHAFTEPLEQYYKVQGLLTAIDGNGSIEDVAERISRSLGLPHRLLSFD